MTRMTRFSRIGAALAILLAASAVPFHPTDVFAQPASAIGEPLAAPELAAGTVSVRVIAGSTSSPVVGGDVTLLVDNAPRVMRTDGGGRAIFTGLPINAKVQARVLDAEQKEVLSRAFTVAEQGGIKLMLSTKPFAGNGGGAAMQAMGMPTGRKASGQPQFDNEIPGGSYQVRLTYDNVSLKDGIPTDSAPPVGSMVTLVGYAHDNSVTVKQQPVDATGVTRFDKLDVSGGTVYYALATLPRGEHHDRLMAMPVPPVSQGGSKVILSGDKREATTKAVDDLAVAAALPTPAGKIRITLDGIVQEASPVRLVDAVSKVELGRIVPSRPPPDASKIESASQFAESTTPPGTLEIDIHGGPGSVDKPLPEVAIRVVPASSATEHPPGVEPNAGSSPPPPPGSVVDTAGTPVKSGSAAGSASPVPAAAGSGAPATAPGSAAPVSPNAGTAPSTTNQMHANANHAGSGAGSASGVAIPARPVVEAAGTPAKTGADGTVTVTMPPGQYKIVYTINGKEFTTTPFDLSKKGGHLEAIARWEGEGRMEALFDFVPRPNQVVYAESTHKNFLYRSLPFLPVPSTGTHVSIVVYPPALFSFSLRALIDDEQLAVRGTFSIEHRSWMPYKDSPDGMIIPLPRGFKGAVIAPESQNDVTVAPGEGLRILRPIPPGGMKFVAGFSLDADGGDVDWSLDLPKGTYQSGIEIRKSDGMTVKGLPAGTNMRVADAENGSQWIVVYPISIHRGKSMQMTIAGVPSHPAWKTWVPRIIGFTAFALIIGGVLLAVLYRKRGAVVDGDARKQQLLDELVELERSGADPGRKEMLLAELERLWK